MMDDKQRHQAPPSDAGAAGGDRPQDPDRMTGREMFEQLQAMASQLVGDAPPALREAAARAAELAAEAARNVRPFAERVLDASGDATSRFADRSERFAAGMRQSESATDEARTGSEDPTSQADS